MKQLIILLAMVAWIAGCTSSGAGDKKAELEKLKKEQKEIADQIKKLEAEIGVSDTASAAQKAELVSVTPVTLEPFVHYIELQGKVDAEENVLVSPQMPGTISKVHVTVGQSVRKGQLLAETDHEAAKKNLETLETQLAFAKDMYSKQEGLWKEKIGTEVQYLSAKNNVETLEKSLEGAKEQLALANLVSPINGVVDAVDIKQGQMGAPGMTGIRVVNLRDLKVKGEVSESYAAQVQPGDKVKLYFPDFNQEIDSKISYAAKVINPQSRTFTVESKLPSKDQFKPNLIAVMRIIDYEKSDAVVVDINLIQKSESGEFVYVAGEENGKRVAKRQPVTSGKIYAGKVEITSGLNKDDKLITTGYQNIISGQLIEY